MTDAEKLEALERMLERWALDQRSMMGSMLKLPVANPGWSLLSARESELGCCIFDVHLILDK